MSCSDLLPSLFFQHPTTHFAPTRCCPINWDSLAFRFFRLPFPFFFDEHPMKMKTFGTLFRVSFPPFRCCLPFRYRTTFRVFVSIPFPKKLFFFSPSFSRSFSFFTRPNPHDPLFLFSPLYTPVQLIWGFLSFWFFFSIPHFLAVFLFFFFFSRPVQNYNLWYPFLRITLPLHAAVLFLLSDNFSGFLNLLNFF